MEGRSPRIHSQLMMAMVRHTAISTHIIQIYGLNLLCFLRKTDSVCFDALPIVSVANPRVNPKQMVGMSISEALMWVDMMGTSVENSPVLGELNGDRTVLDQVPTQAKS